MSRPTKTGLLGMLAMCACGWTCETRNALGLAAQHYDRCGQQVQVEISRVVIYGCDHTQHGGWRSVDDNDGPVMC